MPRCYKSTSPPLPAHSLSIAVLSFIVPPRTCGRNLPLDCPMACPSHHLRRPHLLSARCPSTRLPLEYEVPLRESLRSVFSVSWSLIYLTMVIACRSTAHCSGCAIRGSAHSVLYLALFRITTIMARVHPMEPLCSPPPPVAVDPRGTFEGNLSSNEAPSRSRRKKPPSQPRRKKLPSQSRNNRLGGRPRSNNPLSRLDHKGQEPCQQNMQVPSSRDGPPQRRNWTTSIAARERAIWTSAKRLSGYHKQYSYPLFRNCPS